MTKFLTRKYEFERETVKSPTPLNDNGYWHVAGYSVDYGDRSFGFHSAHPYQIVLWEWKQEMTKESERASVRCDHSVCHCGHLEQSHGSERCIKSCNCTGFQSTTPSDGAAA